MLLLSACGAETADPPVGDQPADGVTPPLSPAPTTAPAATPPAEPSPAPPEADVPTPMMEEPEGLLTEQDDGARVLLDVGEEAPLRLDNAWIWGEPRVEGDAVVLNPVDYLVDPGFVEWIVVGQEPGSATVEVDGEPACADPSDCPPSTVHLEVEVQG